MSIDQLRDIDLGLYKHGTKLKACRTRIAELMAIAQVSDSYAGHIATSFRQFAEYYEGGSIEAEFLCWISWRAQFAEASTVRFWINSIGAQLRDAGVVTEKVFRTLKKHQPRGNNKAVAMSDEQHARVVAWHGMGEPEQRLQQMVLLRILAMTGMRKCEALALKRKDVTLLVKEYRGRWHPALRVLYDVAKQVTPRTEETWCPLDARSRDVVMQFLLVRARPESNLFQKPNGAPLTARSLQHWLDQIKLSPGERGMNPHAMRHRIAQKVQEIYGENVANRVIGHSMRGTTAAYLNAPDIWQPLARVTYGAEVEAAQRDQRSGTGEGLRLITFPHSRADSGQIS